MFAIAGQTVELKLKPRGLHRLKKFEISNILIPRETPAVQLFR